MSNLHYLFPNRYKRIGWIILVPSVILGLVTLILNSEPTFFDVVMPVVYVDEIMGEKQFFTLIETNILNEILGVLVIISGLLVAFSKEKEEDEYIAKIRLESLVWATYVNYAILLVAFFAVYDLTFLWVMIFNMFTILIIFIIRFHWLVARLRKGTDL